MNHKSDILKLIKSNKGYYYDDCISETLNIKPRQQVNAICNKLFYEILFVKNVIVATVKKTS
ncbi:hypothetical protein SAMN02787108_03258 [Lysinibacillus fusiformis]|nr:hypothetical protein SAMN02787108_03258 [Lysinibacillus fusiformis]SDB46282.1 hypothetical protein SAMN02787070_03453 [Lysinibacillus fusiformis]SFI73142.1 hypothetical protein SAMN02787080_03472 [Lysinibacillus fusiformis]SFT15802.1 hypothetical protein SAMN02787099_03173 [Lysinibacillus fusiformis]